MKKTQISTEFIITLSLVMLIFMLTMSSINRRSQDHQYGQRTLDAKYQAKKLAIAINSLHLAGSGAKSQANLAANLMDSTNYSINIYPENRLVEVVWQSRDDLLHHSVQILTTNVTGKIKGIKGRVNLTNTGGVISIES